MKPHGYRPWTAKERDRLRERRPGDTDASLAAELGRTPRGVEAARKRFGVRRKGNRVLAGRDAAVRRLHAAGHSDVFIAHRLGVSPQTARLFCRRLGLPANGRVRGAAYLGRQRKAIARALALQGHRSLGELRAAAVRGEAAKRGWWPHALTPRQCDVLDLLERAPAATRRLCESLGLSNYTGEHNPLATALRTLARRGVIVGVREGKDKVWSLAEGVRRREPGRKRGAGTPPLPAAEEETKSDG